MRLKKIVSVLAAAAMLPAISVLHGSAAGPVSNVRLEPSYASPFNNGEFEGWGTALCWWANRLGYSEELTQQAAELFFSEDGLSLDIARYNIGGGDDPVHTHVNRSDSKVPGVWEDFKLSEDGKDVTITYDEDISKDKNQLNIALAAKNANPDIYFEGFSNSPPYFMTNSGCSSGANNALDNNLKDDMYDDFAEYIAAATLLLEENGIKFESYSPMNEPDTDYWYANSDKQEGCHYTPGESQSKAITETRKALDAKGLDDVLVAGMDETDINKTVSNLDLLTEDALSDLGRIDTHTYSGSKRTELRNKAVSLNKDLWMSEVDGGWDGFGLADRIIADMNGMQPSAWVMWNIIDKHKDSKVFQYPAGSGTFPEAKTTCSYTESLWGVGMGDHDEQNIVVTNKYYIFGQFTRYIEPGDTIIASSDRTLAAYNKESGNIKIVVTNPSNEDIDYNFDLSAFTSVGDTVTEIRSNKNGSEKWAEISGEAVLNGKTLTAPAKANTVTTFVVKGNGATNYASITGGFDELCVGESQRLTVETNLEYDSVEWSVSNTDIAEISEDGTITAKQAGDVTVYAKLGGYTAERTFTVPEHSRIRVSDYNITGTYSWNYDDNSDYLKASDGDLSTYFDGLVDGYVMYDCTVPYTLDVIKLASRAGYEDRSIGGIVQGSNDGEHWTDIYKVTSEIPSMAYTEITKEEMLTDKAFRRFRYTRPGDNANIAEIALYGEQYGGTLPVDEPQAVDIPEFTDNFEGETNIFDAPEDSLSSNGNQVFDTRLTRYGRAFAPVKDTAVSELDEALTLTDDQTFRLTYTMFAGWELNGKDNTLSIKDANKNELVDITLTTGGYSLKELRTGGKAAAASGNISQSRTATSGNKTGANGWFDGSQPFRNNVDFNKTVTIKITGTGKVDISMTGGLENISASGTLTAPVSIKSLELTGDYNNSTYRVVSYDNFDGDILNTNETKPVAPFDKNAALISLDFDDNDLSSSSPYGRAEAVGTVDYENGSLHLDGTGSGYVKLTDANGGSLLTSHDEISIAFSVKPAAADTSWWFFAAPNDNPQTFENEHYIGLLGQSSITAERYNGGTRPSSASAAYAVNEWNDVIVSYGKDSTSVYINGVKASEQPSGFALEDILGSESVAYIGLANWGSGEYANGYIDDFTIYNFAVPEIDLGDLSYVTEDLNLPSESNGSAVTWETSNENVITADGKVTRPDKGVSDVVLTATITTECEGAENIVTKQKFNASVPSVLADVETFRVYTENGELKFAYDDLSNIPYTVYTALHKEDGTLAGIKINAESGSFKLTEDGVYTATCYVWDEDNTAMHDPIKRTVHYSAADDEEKSAYLFVHFVGRETDANCEQIYFSVSEDGQNWRTLNGGKPVLTSTVGEKGVRDPYILRGNDGKYFIIATDLSIYERRGDSNRWTTCQTSGSQNIVVWESDNLTDWSEASLVKVAAGNAGCTWAPEAVYDPEKDMYMVFWASKISDDNYTKQRVYRSYTSDFKTFTEPEAYIDTDVSNIDTTIISHEGIYYRFTKNETKSSVIMEKSTDLSGRWTDVATYNLDEMTGYEGPTAYKINGENKWCLLLDYYSKSQGYKPFVTDDITEGVFTQANDFKFDGIYRHGTVMPITQAEYDALIEKY